MKQRNFTSPKGKVKQIFVATRHIETNDTRGEDMAPIHVSHRDEPWLLGAHRADILNEHGEVLVSVIYDKESPLPSGARVWVETDLEVRVTERLPDPD